MSKNVISLIVEQSLDVASPILDIADSGDPLRTARAFLTDCGWDVTVDADITSIIEAIEGIATSMSSILADPVPDSLEEVIALLGVVRSTIADVTAIGDAFAAIASPGEVDPAAVLMLCDDIAHFLVVSWLDRRGPILPLLDLIGLVERVEVDPAALGWLQRPAGWQRRVRLQVIDAIVSDPTGYVLARTAPHGWDDVDAAYETLLLVSSLVATTFRGRGAMYLDPHMLRNGSQSDRQARSALSLHLPNPGGLSAELGAALRFVSSAETTESGHSGPAVEVEPYGSISLGVDLGNWMLALSAVVSAVGPAAPLEIGRPGLLATPTFDADLDVTLHRRIDLDIGTDRSGLHIGSVALSVHLGAGVSDAEVAVAVDLTGSSFGLDTADLGPTFSSLVNVAVALPFDLGVSWSNIEGLRITGSVDLSITLVRELSIANGAVVIRNLVLDVDLDGGLGLTISGDISFNFGPVAASIGGLGLTGGIELATPGGNLGGANFSIGGTAPDMLALGLDLGVAKGGGMLHIDVQAGKYEGAIQLEVMSVGISAFVIIETKRPDIDGWSMMMALYIEIPAIQLGFGFTLSGVGGLAGINRGIDPEALGDAVRSGSLDTILFPDDPIADAPIIIDTLASIFPAADGQYVFGPVVKIGWGTPTLVEISVGVVIELPDPIRIAILGSIAALLPRPEVPLVELHLDVAGVIDFEAGTIAIDASLHHSTIVGFALAGDMALRAGFKGQPTFLFSLGGFHPDFEPPAGFPALRRLSIGLNAGPVFRVSFECYLAITSNTVQFGTALELVATVSGFGIEGGFEFDALIQFNPFRLNVSLGMHISVTALGVDLMGVWLHGRVEGPNPWHITGYAEFKALGITKRVNVDEIIGSRTNEVEPAAPNLLELIAEALDDPDAWAAGTSSSDGVTLAEPEPGSTEVIASPHGTVEVGQNVVPLGETIDKYGNAENIEHVRFVLEVGGALQASGSIRNWFSPGQYHELNNTERLAAPSFEEMDAGIVLGGGISTGQPRPTALGHEAILLDSDYEAWEAEHARPNRPSWRPEFVSVIDAGAFASAVADIALVEAAGVFAVAEPTYVLSDELTGAVASSSGSFLAASVGRRPGQVISMVGEAL
jgi:hypothetical protein